MRIDQQGVRHPTESDVVTAAGLQHIDQCAECSGFDGAANVASVEQRLSEANSKLVAVRALHKEARVDVEPWASGYKWSGHHCAYDGQHWPCDTIAALDSNP